MNRKKYAVFFFLSVLAMSGQAQTNDGVIQYRRSSLYSMLIQHPDKKFAQEIAEIFYSIPVPDKFDNHDLNIKVVNAILAKRQKEIDTDVIEEFFKNNAVGRRLVAKWFNKNMTDGTFDMNLIFERGFFNASVIDAAIAQHSARGKAMLADAGVELIGNTFIIVHDIRYVDKEKKAQTTAMVFKAFAGVAGAVAGGAGLSSNLGRTADLAKSIANLGGSVSDIISGFKVVVTSHLFRLNWNEEVANVFYQYYYMDKKSYDPARKAAFEKDKQWFTITYIGSQDVKSNKTSIRGVQTNGDMIKKVCTRAIDKAIAELQLSHEEFRIKTPLISVEPLLAYIGTKEGITNSSRFEVLERIEDENGYTSYNRVGIIRPVRNGIWDNRYLAVEEGFDNAELHATQFERVSGRDFYTGMLIREIR